MNTAEPHGETTEDASKTGSGLLQGNQGLPALVLAHNGESRPPEVRFLPAGGVRLGRGCEVFDGGPLVDSRMSREHAEIARKEGRWELADLESRNGTWLQGKRIQKPMPLAPNAVIRVGDTALVFALCTSRASGRIVGVSAEMGAIHSAILGVAASRTTVLITGETGTGKELVAQEIHAPSARKGRLVSVNCATIPEGVLSSELFGHVRGAFTGAAEAREGLFRAADGGTLFLDEIGEMPINLQAQLLRVLETGQIRPVGSARDLPVDVRVVAATNRDLPSAIQTNLFRPDLYVRLAQSQIRLPPLRQRRADIPFLARALLERRGVERPMTIELASALLLHSWPFNVRGLQNALMAAELGSPAGEPLGLCPEVRQVLDADEAISGAASQEALARLIPGAPSRVAVEAALVGASGRVTDAARHLGCSRQQLYRWISVYKLDVSSLRKP